MKYPLLHADDSYFCHRGGGQVVFKNTCESLLFAMRAVSSVAHQPHLGFLSGCDRELKHGFTFPLSSSSDAGDPPDTCIMQSCNLQSCNQADLSLAAHRRGATKPIPCPCPVPRLIDAASVADLDVKRLRPLR